jgi:hypothetical protein
VLGVLRALDGHSDAFEELRAEPAGAGSESVGSAWLSARPACEGAGMATIYRTTMAPTKLELLGDWLPRQPWYRSTGRPPALTRAGGFRLDDPTGEVGIEFIVVTEGTAGEETTYLVPLAYRDAPLPEADEGLLGTSEHGVLGRRWVYDGAHDPVVVAQLLAFLSGEAEAQHQDDSDTPDPSVGRHRAAGRVIAPGPLRVANTEPGRTTVAVELTDVPPGESGPRSLDLVRILEPSALDGGAQGLGRVEAEWRRSDGSSTRGTVAVVR